MKPTLDERMPRIVRRTLIGMAVVFVGTPIFLGLVWFGVKLLVWLLCAAGGLCR